MKPVETALDPITGYLISLSRNTIDGWYELEIGIPKGWVFNDNKDIKCEVVTEFEDGKIIKIAPKHNKIVPDDLIAFVEIILSTNKRIAEKEKEFSNKMVELRDTLEQKAKKFYEELDELRENSFNNLNSDFEKSLGGEKKKRTRKPKTPITVPDKITFSGDTETQTQQPAIKIDVSRTA